jgi:opacity protein-like surface antigen
VNTKVVVYLLVFLFSAAVATRAQDLPKFDAFAGYSYVRANPENLPDPRFPGFAESLPSFNMNGGDGSLAYNINRWVSGVFDFSGYVTSRMTEGLPGIHGGMYTFLLGPKLSFRNSSRFTPFTQVLLGAAHTTSRTYLEANQAEFAMTLGGGVDFRLNHRVSLRPLQADYLLTHFRENDSLAPKRFQNNVRLGVGLVFHFY